MEKQDKGLWWKDPEIKGGKYVVLRRDGTVLDGPYFVLGPRDPATPSALLGYVKRARAMLAYQPGADQIFNQKYLSEIVDLAEEIQDLQTKLPVGDPGKGPHRKDHPLVIEQMQNPDKKVLAP